MKTKHNLLLGGFVAISAIIIAFWLRKETPAELLDSKNPVSQTETIDSNLTPMPSVAQTPKAAAGTNPPSTSGKRYAELGVLEQNAILMEIQKQELPKIFQAMLNAERLEHDDLKQMHLQTVFADALKIQKPTPEFLEQMYQFVINATNSQFERDLLIGALGHAATKESVTLLLRLAKTAPDVKVREAAASLGGLGRPNQNVADLSPILERTWLETSDPILIGSTSSAMARFGTARGVELLLSAALAKDGRDEERQQEAQSALQIVTNEDAVPPLAARLKDQAPASEVVKLVAPILAGTNGTDGQQALVSWLQGRPENAALQIEDFFVNHIRIDPFESAWGKAIDPAVPFANEENRKAIREALDRYRAGRKQDP